jgi:hypothetical protein
MELYGHEGQAEQQLHVSFLQRVLVVEFEPIIKVLVNLIVRLSRYLSDQGSPAHVRVLLGLSQDFIGFGQVGTVHVVDSKVLSVSLLLFDHLLEVKLSERIKVVRDVTILEHQVGHRSK